MLNRNVLIARVNCLKIMQPVRQFIPSLQSRYRDGTMSEIQGERGHQSCLHLKFMVDTGQQRSARYGWSGEAVDRLECQQTQLKLDIHRYQHQPM